MVRRDRGDGMVLTKRGVTAAGVLLALRCAASAGPATAAAAGRAAAAVAVGGRKRAQPSTWRICQRSDALRLHRHQHAH